jgi:hypothetical protein
MKRAITSLVLGMRLPAHVTRFWPRERRRLSGASRVRSTQHPLRWSTNRTRRRWSTNCIRRRSSTRRRPSCTDRRPAPTGMAMATVTGATTGTIAVGVKIIGIEVGTTITAVGTTAVGTTTDRPRHHGRNTPRPRSCLTTNEHKRSRCNRSRRKCRALSVAHSHGRRAQ